MNVARYVGIPYQAPRGCWELLRLVYRVEYGILLPSYAADWTALDSIAPANVASLIATQRSAWVRAEEPAGGAAALFRIAGLPVHIGIVVSASHFLHVQRGGTARVESFLDRRWQPRLDGFYRYAGIV